VAGKKGVGCDIRKNFAIVFKTWRQRNSLLLKQIAAELGVSASTVNLWEMGRRFPTGKNIEALAQYTGLPPCRLFCLMAAKCTRRLCLLKNPPQS
jgi:transcriptional regulator with XRE-family HTH domain